MTLDDAQKILRDTLHSYPYDDFFENIVGRQHLTLLNHDSPELCKMIGEDPKQVILDAFALYSSKLTSHIGSPQAPSPMARAVESATEFQQLINEYHQRGYTVRIPDVTDMSNTLSLFTRALEVILENPVCVVIFWSAEGATAPVHNDDVDVIVIQLMGTKKWFVSDEQPELSNRWKCPAETQPMMGRYSTVDVKPGDLMYVPRGTTHTVESTSESIHLSIGFAPVTIRDAINAVLDQVSDLDRSLRTHLGRRADNLARKEASDMILEQIRSGLEKVTTRCRSNDFVHESLAYRRSKMIAELPKLPPQMLPTEITLKSKIRHSPLAMAQLISTPNILDFTHPGGHLLIHPGVEDCMHFIINTPTFYVAELPGEIGDDVRVAIVNKLLGVGYLTLSH